ncbi:MAG: T9SS type A sorting domain-containing protein, partial [Bacteroidales bacterium]|nr:T9SS type A sorting domain-containing protein [Bacteroidales bacterium]
HVLNYPNPFTTHTSFFFEHNQAGETFEILIQIFTISGKLVKTISDTQYLPGNRSEKLDWNGLDDFGDKIAKGTYIYKLSVKNSKGEKAEKFEKIVIL